MNRTYDVFISYSHKDSTVANTVCAKLEESSIRCWIAPRDIVPGADWGASIIDGIEAAEIMLLILSAEANASPQVKREVERAVHKGRHIIPLRIEDIPLSKSLEYFLSSPHWLDALTPPLEKHLDQLVRTVKAVLGAKEPSRATCPECEKKIVSKARLEGRKIRCPGCQAVFLVPAADSTPPKPRVTPVARRKRAGSSWIKPATRLVALLAIAGGSWLYTQVSGDGLGAVQPSEDPQPVDPRRGKAGDGEAPPSNEQLGTSQGIEPTGPSPVDIEHARGLVRDVSEATTLKGLRELIVKGVRACSSTPQACKVAGLDQSLDDARQRVIEHEELLDELEQLEAGIEAITTLAQASALERASAKIQAALDVEAIDARLLTLSADLDKKVSNTVQRVSKASEAVELITGLEDLLAQVPAGERQSSLKQLASPALDLIDRTIQEADSPQDLGSVAAALSKVAKSQSFPTSELEVRKQTLVARSIKLLANCKTPEEALKLLIACDGSLAVVEASPLREQLISSANHPLSVVSAAVSEVSSIIADEAQPLVTSLASFDSQAFGSAIDEWHGRLVSAIDQEVAEARNLKVKSNFADDLNALAGDLPKGKLRTRLSAQHTALAASIEKEWKDLFDEGDRLLANRQFVAAKSAFKKIQSLSPRKSRFQWIAKLKEIETTQRRGDDYNGKKGKKEHMTAVVSLEELLKANPDERDFNGKLITQSATEALVASCRWLESYFSQLYKATRTRDSNNYRKRYRDKRIKAESDLRAYRN